MFAFEKTRERRTQERKTWRGAIAKKGRTLASAAIAVVAFAGPAWGQTSGTTWNNAATTTVKGKFQATFNAIPNGANIDGVTGLSYGPATAYTKLAVIIRFNDQGKIDVRNGSTYGATTSLTYTAGRSYRFRVVGDLATHKYDVFVLPSGTTSETQIAQGYAFRTEQATVAQLNNRAIVSTIGSETISNFAVLDLSATPTPTPAPTATPAPSATPNPAAGIAGMYPGDTNIESNPDVLFVERFESSTFWQRWGYSSAPYGTTARVITSDSANQFVPLQGNAYRVTIPAGQNFGAATELKTTKFLPAQPDELYFRYMLRLAPNFRDVSDGGKMPGMAGDTSICGNGGRACDGTTGWSLRGSFLTTSSGSTFYPKVLLGTYAYHADMTTTYGDHWRWLINNGGYVNQNQWYSVEQYVKMNTPGYRNGILKVWIDGKLVYEKYDMNLRELSSLHIYKIWLNVYFGGTGTPAHNMDMYIDNMVVAKKYIGPMVR